MTAIFRCQSCKNRLIQKSTDGRVRLRTKIVVFDGGRAEAICQQCGSAVDIDIHLGANLQKAIDLSSGPRLILKK